MSIDEITELRRMIATWAANDPASGGRCEECWLAAKLEELSDGK